MPFLQNRFRISSLLLLSVAWFACNGLPLPVRPAGADDWLFFRGPANNGVSAETGWSTHWPAAGPRVVWRTNVGSGASSVVVAGEHVITMGSRQEENEEVVWCLDAQSGRPLWQH